MSTIPVHPTTKIANILTESGLDAHRGSVIIESFGPKFVEAETLIAAQSNRTEKE